MSERPRVRARWTLRRLKSFLLKGFVSTRTRVVVAGDQEECLDPIFIVGVHRSGTSLLRRVVDSHRSIACPPESFWLRHFTPMLEDDYVFEGLEGLGFDRPAALAELGRAAARFHELYRRAKGKPRWADKTPVYTFHLETLWTLFQPGARFVLLVRHPADVAFSLWRRGWEFERRAEDAVENACLYVIDAVGRQLAFREAHPEIVHLVTYDRLVREPEDTTRALCRFLEEPWDEGMLRFAQLQHDVGVEDPVVRGTRGFQGSFENWRAWSDEERRRAFEILGPTMDTLGYDTESAWRRHRD